ncbi:uncharacterized protein Z518_10834 [Rhinocladiella mackenziei CBS 650.93]|uniref:Rhinocladiella mackenziei CBS 650.93 unplaced genomic scaffold supercont1.10, whole genome shotgun sequence n=1 Tax=Rhinocladiella mackenziei CBS 650.93 TaxID=1442369 RepID=A0A0D2FCU3_9EURO|nr:uncharacterized protein Z518_10834 [Rhinocladiella mackenziei CBS 650.93]KIW99906.1 hypothetical protein Z518_10834 [Rhinocladiella mackenziei CBS 650.93]
MAQPSHDERPLIDPVATPGPLMESGMEERSGPQPTETTVLLPRSNGEKPSNVHYRNISGPRFVFLFTSIMFGSTIAFFDSTLMASSHPVITSYFHASNAASWLSTVFYLTSTVFQPLYGRVSDTIGRRPVFLFAIFMFFASTAWCGAARTMGSFIAARAACGLGAGGVTAMAGILTSDVVKIEYRGIYQSYFNMSFGLGNGLGAALGGFLCDHFGWRAAFYLQLPFILVYGLLGFFSCPPDLGPNLAQTHGKTLREAFKTFDTFGAIGLTATVTCLILGVNLGGNVFTWTHPLVITSLVLFVVAATSLFFIEREAQLPILPLKFLSTIPNGNLMWGNFFGAIVTNTVLFNVPLYLQAVRQTTPTVSGLYLVSPLVGVSITSLIAGAYITITRRMKPPVAAGTFSMFCGAVSVTCLSSSTPISLVPVLIPICSIGQGFYFPATTIAVLALNSQDEQAVTTTTLGLLRNLGSILGVAISSWILQNALLIYLAKCITDPDQATKNHIIRTVRESISAIATLDPVHKRQVIEAYALSLRVTFTTGIVGGLLSIGLIWPVHLPRLPRQADMDNRDAGVFVPNEEVAEYEYETDADEDDDDDDDQALLDTPPQSIHRTLTENTVHSRTSNSMVGFEGRVSIHGRGRRASFDTRF